MIIKLLNKEGVVPPVSAHPSDVGQDLIAISDPKIVGNMISDGVYKSIDYIEYDTGLIIAPEPSLELSSHEPLVWSDDKHQHQYGYTLIYPRSSISKYNLILANGTGVVDHGFRNSIKCRFKYHVQPEDLGHIENVGIVCIVNKDKIYKKGQAIAQLVCAWKENITWKLVDTLDETARGEGGFGSSDKPKHSGSIV